MDYPSWYKRISQPFRSPGAARALGVLDRVLVYAFAAVYIGLLAVLLFTGNAFLARALIVPAITFALTTALRMLVNRPRPYEAHDIDPVIHKDTQGKSMPSRHMTSAVIIAFTCCIYLPALGIALFCACACIAFTRIVGGVHYPTDIAAAIGVGLACGILGFLVP